MGEPFNAPKLTVAFKQRQSCSSDVLSIVKELRDTKPPTSYREISIEIANRGFRNQYGDKFSGDTIRASFVKAYPNYAGSMTPKTAYKEVIRTIPKDDPLNPKFTIQDQYRKNPALDTTKSTKLTSRVLIEALEDKGVSAEDILKVLKQVKE